jgi:diguanylate cyclase (GGDEF)-like protein
MIDIDHFKRVNDTFGHPRGDAVLVETARRMSARARAADVVGRLGGEELAVLLPSTDLDGAVAFAEGLRSAIADEPYEELGPLTISAGVAAFDGDAERMMAEADAALYRAKQGGRNRVVHA